MRIGLSFWFFVVFALISFFDTDGMLLCSLVAAMLHETGHLIAMVIKNDLPTEIDIHIFNVDIVDNSRPIRNPNDDIFILCFGGVFNLILAVVSIVIFRLTNSAFIYMFFASNLMLGIFNLLPISVLDGGQIVESLLLKHLKPKATQIISDIISLIILLPLSVLGFYILLQSKYNFSLLIISLYLIGLLIFNRRAYL